MKPKSVQIGFDNDFVFNWDEGLMNTKLFGTF